MGGRPALRPVRAGQDPPRGGGDRPGHAAAVDDVVSRDQPSAPDAPTADGAPFVPADLAEIVRLYGLRNWVEQGYKQLKQELGWADFMVRADQAIRHHWHLVFCAFSFCWRAWFTTGPPPTTTEPAAPADSDACSASERGENAAQPPRPSTTGLLATDDPPGARLARPLDLPLALLARLVERAPAP